MIRIRIFEAAFDMDSSSESCFESDGLGKADAKHRSLAFFDFRRSIMPFVVQPRFDVGSLLSSVA